MKKMICMLLACILLLGTCAAVASGQFMYVVNCGEWVSLRSSPSTAASRLAKVPLGAQVANCVPAADGFTFCEYNGMAGYILSAYLSADSGEVEGPDVTPNNMLVVNCDEWVSLRKGPSKSSDRLTKVPLGAMVTNCEPSSNGFVYCEYNGMCGFIRESYLQHANAAAGMQSSFEEQYGAYYESMTVFNCNEWVSLRNAPSISSPRIIEVPLGATVTECLEVRDGFIYCRYAGMSGYIQAQYLMPAAPGSAASSGQTPSGNEILRYSHGGYTITAYLEYVENGEKLAVFCHDASGSRVWDYVTASAEIAQLNKTHAFIGGTQDAPMVMVYNADIGLSALGFENGAELWTMDGIDVFLGGSISAATASDGTMYIGGFDGPSPVAISADGELLWTTSLGDDIYWLADIQVTNEGVVAFYDCVHEHEVPGSVCFGFDGSVRWISQG